MQPHFYSVPVSAAQAYGNRGSITELLIEVYLKAHDSPSHGLFVSTVPLFSRNILIRSIGTGKMIVEFFSEEISARVCR